MSSPSALPPVTVEVEAVVGAATLAEARHQAAVVLETMRLGA